MQRNYWWIVCRDNATGKQYLIFGSSIDENDARQKGLELLGGADFLIRKFPTRDLGTASSMLKGHNLRETHSLSQASKRLGHEKSLNRIRHGRRF